ncbi:MAG: hypothetical protein AcusKO_47800 [Acuticoccus sp.]
MDYAVADVVPGLGDGPQSARHLSIRSPIELDGTGIAAISARATRTASIQRIEIVRVAAAPTVAADRLEEDALSVKADRHRPAVREMDVVGVAAGRRVAAARLYEGAVATVATVSAGGTERLGDERRLIHRRLTGVEVGNLR